MKVTFHYKVNLLQWWELSWRSWFPEMLFLTAKSIYFYAKHFPSMFCIPRKWTEYRTEVLQNRKNVKNRLKWCKNCPNFLSLKSKNNVYLPYQREAPSLGCASYISLPSKKHYYTRECILMIFEKILLKTDETPSTRSIYQIFLLLSIIGHNTGLGSYLMTLCGHIWWKLIYLYAFWPI